MFRFLAAFLTVLSLSACSIVSTPISKVVETRLQRERMSDREFGARFAGTGQSIRFTMFTGEALPQPVTVPMAVRFRGLPTLDLVLNDRHTVRMLADTGAQLSIVDAKNVLAGKGRIYVPDRWNFTVTGIGGSEQAWLARFEKAKIGSITLRSFTTVVRRKQTEIKLGRMRVGSIPINLLGCPVLLGFRYVTFDYQRRRFVFSPGTSYRPSAEAIGIPMVIKDQLIYVPVRIGNRTIPAMVDTGAKDQLFLNTKTVKELGLQSRAAAGGTYRALGVGGESAGRQFSLPLVFLAGVPIQNVLIDTSDTASWDVRVGNDLLNRWRVTFDFERKRMWLESP